MSPNERTDWTLMARYLTGEASVAERKKVDKVMEGNQNLREFVAMLEILRSKAQTRGEDWDIETEWARLARQVGFSEKTVLRLDRQEPIVPPDFSRTSYLSKHYTAGWRIAASIVLLLVTFYALHRFAGLDFRSDSSERLAMREIRTEVGQRVHLELSDGSSVDLNASSAIRFPEQFGISSREVELQGEAFFDVAKRGDSRFIVRAQGTVIQVLGTRFDVKAWLDDSSVDVVVERGRVLVQSQTSSREGVILSEGQMTRVTRGSEPSEPLSAPLALSIAWLDGRMLFEQTPFSDVVKELERNYGLHIQLEDSSLAMRHLSASFTRAQSSVDIVKAISVALNMSYRQKGNSIVFVPSKTHGRKHP